MSTPLVPVPVGPALVLLGMLLLAACQFPTYDLAGPEPGTTSGGPGSGGKPATGGDGGAPPVTAPQSCRTVLDAEPVAISGTTWIDPDGAGGAAPFQAYCDMTTDFGGWTLLGSFNNDGFDAGYRGLTDDPCYETACVNRAYSTVLLANDVRVDAADAPIVAEAWELSLFSRQVHESLRGRTLQQVFEDSGPAFLEAPGGTVVTSFQNGRTCSTGWGEFSSAACSDAAVFVFGDPSSCDEVITFALGVAPNYTDLASNCDGWPQNPGLNFPRNLRFWSR